MKKRTKHALLGILCVVLIATMGIVFFIKKQEEKERALAAKRYDFERICGEVYDSVFFSMFSIDGYSEEDFAFFRGTDTVLSTYEIPSAEVLSEYMSAVFSTENAINHVFWGLDPEKLWESCGKKLENWNRNMEEEILPVLAQNPELTFDIMLAYPSLEHWLTKSQEELDSIVATYLNLVNWLEAYENVNMYYLGHEEWMIANSHSYTESGSLNPMLAQKMMLYTFCDGVFQIDGENAEILLGELSALVQAEREKPSEYPDLSGWKVVFFGDSIFGNYEGSSAASGVVTALSGAETYNFAIGGTQGADGEGYHNSFPDKVEAFLTRNLSTTFEENIFPYESITEAGENLCFVINYGLNDYFNGQQVADETNAQNRDTYAGALRVGVDKLKEAYPEAVIILMTPPYCDLFEGGTMKNGEAGGTLAEYVAAVEQVAAERNVLCQNNYSDFGITPENFRTYLEDGVHFNEYGRFMLGKRIIELVGNGDL